MYEYQDTQRYFGQLAGGLDELATAELQSLGVETVNPGYRGLYFKADAATLYRVNYCSRLLTRVLAPLSVFMCHSPDYLYRKVREIDWSSIIQANQTFAVFANVSDSKITHSRYAALKVKDAIVDQCRDRTGRRPNVDTNEPDLWVNLHLARNQGTISLDASGGSLHRRGYRKDSVEAPMLETLAAAILEFAEWDGVQPLYDPMCGSGTLLSEAWMRHCRIPAGYLRRRFGFMMLPDYDPRLWRRVKKEADQRIREPGRDVVGGSDLDGQAVGVARSNNALLPSGERLRIRRQDFRDIPNLEKRIIVCNPPYGVRLKRGEDLPSFYRDFGDFLKQRCLGSAAYVYFGERALLKSIGLRPAWKKPLSNGGLDGRLAKFEMY